MQVIILAGGFGSRLRTVVSDVPKPLAPIGGRPFLAWLVDVLTAQGATGITLSVHHEWEKIRDYFDRHPPALPLTYAVEPEPLGTGGAIAFALSQCPASEPVIVMNGDTFVRVDYRALYAQHCRSGDALTLALRRVPDTGRYGEVQVQEGRVTAFAPGREGEPGFINAGLYVMQKGFFDSFPLPAAFSFEQDFLRPYAPTIRPGCFLADGYFIDIGIPADYARACDELPRLLAQA